MKYMNGKVSTALKAFMATWAVIRICNLATTNILTVFAFAFFCFTFHHIMQLKVQGKETKREKYAEVLLSILFTVFYVGGDFEHIYAGLDNMLFKLVILMAATVGLYIIFNQVISLLLILTRNLTAEGEPEKRKYMALITFFACLICWLPYLFKNYPGIMTIDSMNQFAQVVGVYADSNHHPWVHTQLMKLFYIIGGLFTENTSIAISFYTVFQMCFMAGCAAYLVDTLAKYHVKKWVLFLTIAFYALIPYNGIYAVTVWKDTMFAGGVLLFVTTLFRILKESGKQFIPKENIVPICLYLLSGIMMCLFRTNGWYAFLLLTPLLIWVLRKQWKRIVPMQVLIIVVVLIVKGPVMNAFDVIQPDLIESLSIPVQQISKVIVDEKPLTEEQYSFLNRILDTSKIKDLYNPYVSDGFKRLVRAGDQTYLREHMGEFLKIYVQIGLNNPGEYLIAFRDQSIGYWFPTQEGLFAADEGVIENEFGVANIPVIKGPIVIKLNEIALKLKDMLPGYGILWSMGALFWVILLAMGIIFARGNRELLLLYVPCIAIFLTLIIATPVAKEFRYAYAYICCIPLYLTVPFLKNKVPEIESSK